MKNIYALLTVIGIVLPFSQFIVWLTEHGFDYALFFKHIIQNPLASFAWLDVVITVIVIVVMVLHEGKKTKMNKLWIPILASFIGGAAVGLPLYLYMKEIHREKLGSEIIS